MRLVCVRLPGDQRAIAAKMLKTRLLELLPPAARRILYVDADVIVQGDDNSVVRAHAPPARRRVCSRPRR